MGARKTAEKATAGRMEADAGRTGAGWWSGCCRACFETGWFPHARICTGDESPQPGLVRVRIALSGHAGAADARLGNVK